MSMKDMERFKKLIEEKKVKNGILKDERKIGSGKVEKKNQSIGIDATRTYKISH